MAGGGNTRWTLEAFGVKGKGKMGWENATPHQLHSIKRSNLIKTITSKKKDPFFGSRTFVVGRRLRLPSFAFPFFAFRSYVLNRWCWCNAATLRGRFTASSGSGICTFANFIEKRSLYITLNVTTNETRCLIQDSNTWRRRSLHHLRRSRCAARWNVKEGVRREFLECAAHFIGISFAFRESSVLISGRDGEVDSERVPTNKIRGAVLACFLPYF